MRFILLMVILVSHLAWAETQTSPNEQTSTKPKAQPLSVAQMPIEIQGADADVEANIRAWLPAALTCDARPFQQRMWYRLALKESAKALQALGYYRPSMDIRFETGLDEQSCPHINICVDAGKPVRYRQVTLSLLDEGKNDAVIAQSWQKMAVQPGEIVHHGHYEDTKSALAQRLEERGYFDADYQQARILVNPETYQADAAITLTTGVRYHFSQVHFNQTILHDWVVKRYSPIEEGQAFDANLLNELSQNLANSGYFSDVRIRQGEADQQTHEVPIDVELVPRKRMSYAFSVGYGSDTGERIGADIKRYWLNKRGHYANLAVQYALKKRNIEAHYVVPWKKPLTERLDWGFRMQYEENFHWGNDSSVRFGPSFVRELSDGWTGVLFSELLSARTEFLGDQVRDGQFLFVGARISKREGDDPIFPTEGWSLMAEVKATDPGGLSTTSLVQGRFNMQGLLPLGQGSLLMRTQAGYTWVENFDRLPKPLRFYTGGDTSVRGYSFESLSPANAAGALIGGQHYVAATVEYLHPMNDHMQLATFVDMGNAFNDWGKGLENLKEGTGVGIRYKTPVGYVKADIAFPISQADAWGSPMLHLGIGASF